MCANLNSQKIEIEILSNNHRNSLDGSILINRTARIYLNSLWVCNIGQRTASIHTWFFWNYLICTKISISNCCMHGQKSVFPDVCNNKFSRRIWSANQKTGNGYYAIEQALMNQDRYLATCTRKVFIYGKVKSICGIKYKNHLPFFYILEFYLNGTHLFCVVFVNIHYVNQRRICSLLTKLFTHERNIWIIKPFVLNKGHIQHITFPTIIVSRYCLCSLSHLKHGKAQKYLTILLYCESVEHWWYCFFNWIHPKIHLSTFFTP